MNMSDQPPQVVVRGEALLTVEPEVADLGLTVSGRGRDRQSALERCRARQDEVSAVLSAAGDAVESEETAWVSVDRDLRDGGSQVATVHSRVTVGRLEAVGDLLVALGRLDDVAVSGPGWRLRPGSPVEVQARLDAVRDAVQRARQYAAAFGAELTTLLEVRDTGVSGGFQVAEAVTAMRAFGDGELALDLVPARQEVRGSVEVRFAMSAPDEEVFRG